MYDPPLLFCQASPHAEAFIVVHRVVEAFNQNGARVAHILGSLDVLLLGRVPVVWEWVIPACWLTECQPRPLNDLVVHTRSSPTGESTGCKVEAVGLTGIDMRVDPIHRHATDKEKEAARIMVGVHALDPDDEMELLEMLGLEK